MTKSDHRKPINFVGMYLIDEHGEDYRLSSADFNKVCDNCGSRHWQFFADVEARKRWIAWLNTPDPSKEKMGKVVHLKPKPDQPA